MVNTTLASPTVYGNIRPVGATVLGATLRVNVTVPSGAVIPVGTQFNIIQTQAGTLQSGTDGSVVAVTVQDPTNPLYTFAATPLAGTIAGQVTIRTLSVPLLVPINPPTGGVLPPTLPTAAVIAPVLVALVPSAVTDPQGGVPSNPDLSAVVGSINALSDAGAVVQAVAQLAPSTVSQAAPLLAFQTARQFQGLWQSRLENILCNPATRPEQEISVCEGNLPRSNWWMKGFGSSGTQGARQSFAGYGSTIVGTMIGYDMPIGPSTRIGLGIGFADSVAQENHSANKTDFQTYQATAYIGHRTGPWFVHGDASVGYNDYTGTRQIAFPGVNRLAKASYGGQNVDVSAATGYDFPVGRFTLTPLASLQYTNVHINGFQETGAGAINLRVGSQSYDFLESGLGVKLAREFTLDVGVLVPEVHGKWLHELVNPTLSQTVAFAAPGATAFSTLGMKTGADTLNAGFSMTLYSCTCGPKSWSVEAGYDYFRRSDKYEAHQGLLKLTARF